MQDRYLRRLFKRRASRKAYPRVPYWYSWSKKRQRNFLCSIIEGERETQHRATDRWLKAAAERDQLQKELDDLRKEKGKK